MYTINKVAMAALISFFQLGQGLAEPAPAPQVIPLDQPAIATRIAEYMSGVWNHQDGISVNSVLATALPSSMRNQLPLPAGYKTEPWYTSLDDKAKRWEESVNSELAYLATGGTYMLSTIRTPVSLKVTSPVLLAGTGTTVLTQTTFPSISTSTSVATYHTTTIAIEIHPMDKKVEQSIAATHNGGARETGVPRAMVGAMGVIGIGAAAMMV